MSNTQLLINQLQDVLTRGSLSTAYFTNFSGQFYLRGQLSAGTILAILALLAKFAKINTCKISSLKVHSYV